MSGSVPPVPSLADFALAFASGDSRLRAAALSVKPPDRLDPDQIKLILDAARQAQAAARNGVDIKA